jgi:hypothetical protein
LCLELVQTSCKNDEENEQERTEATKDCKTQSKRKPLDKVRDELNIVSQLRDASRRRSVSMSSAELQRGVRRSAVVDQVRLVVVEFGVILEDSRTPTRGRLLFAGHGVPVFLD